MSPLCPSRNTGGRTLARGVLAVEVLGGVAAEDAAALGLGGGALGQPLVELDDVGHLEGVGVGTKSLQGRLCQPLLSFPVIPSRSTEPSFARSRCRIPSSHTAVRPQQSKISCTVRRRSRRELGAHTLGEAICDGGRG